MNRGGGGVNELKSQMKQMSWAVEETEAKAVRE